MRLWVDDVRPAPEGWTWVKSVNEAKIYICQMTRPNKTHNIEIISIDHDAGNYACNGEDYIKLLDWMEEKEINDISIHIHSMNPVGVQNMRRIIARNGWKEIVGNAK